MSLYSHQKETDHNAIKCLEVISMEMSISSHGTKKCSNMLVLTIYMSLLTTVRLKSSKKSQMSLIKKMNLQTILFFIFSAMFSESSQTYGSNSVSIMVKKDLNMKTVLSYLTWLLLLLILQSMAKVLLHKTIEICRR